MLFRGPTLLNYSVLWLDVLHMLFQRYVPVTLLRPLYNVLLILTQLILALVSAILTIYLTASTSFVTRKDSGVLSPDFATPTEDSKLFKQPSESHPKRKALYYAAGSGIPEIKTILSGTQIITNCSSPSNLPFDRLRHTWLPWRSHTIYQGRRTDFICCIGPLTWKRRSFCAHRQLPRKYCKPVFLKV